MPTLELEWVVCESDRLKSLVQDLVESGQLGQLGPATIIKLQLLIKEFMAAVSSDIQKRAAAGQTGEWIRSTYQKWIEGCQAWLSAAVILRDHAPTHFVSAELLDSLSVAIEEVSLWRQQMEDFLQGIPPPSVHQLLARKQEFEARNPPTGKIRKGEEILAELKAERRE